MGEVCNFNVKIHIKWSDIYISGLVVCCSQVLEVKMPFIFLQGNFYFFTDFISFVESNRFTSFQLMF